MSTRAAYTFKSDGASHSVFIHYDGYPTGAAGYLKTTLNSGLAWTLPRFEAEEFACAFIAANKPTFGGGGIRLMKNRRQYSDIEYAYTVWQGSDRNLMVDAHTVEAWDSWQTKRLWRGALSEFIAIAETLERG